MEWRVRAVPILELKLLRVSFPGVVVYLCLCCKNVKPGAIYDAHMLTAYEKLYGIELNHRHTDAY